MPRTQENQGQPFVSKHFNVIDPLRTNNNLGRSVNKGNYQSTFRLSYRWSVAIYFRFDIFLAR
jgi:hypothetical protein